MGVRDADAVRNSPTVGIPGSDLGWHLGVILRSWHERVEQAVEGVPHGTRGYQILSVVGHNDPPTQSGLAKHLQIDKTVMPYVIDALEGAGLVERRTDPADRRVRRIAITPSGAAKLTELEAKVRAAEDAVFGNVPAPLRRMFVDNAAQLATSLHNDQPALDPCLAVMDALADPALGSTQR
ncbi:MarR family transcriptional regulator [Verrucosispora sp. WMMD573]|uniref:MarR family winged helix-turn-helix transcriptional regulator n=1 Tax=Verrucosispora sp. WMMD573 TaxID=3015149 RepID=UPI00248B467B|nr:MarR family transcriptional regulator [Verrucosispora sp. WMMD573]WBB53816.1 MarR family transcriptional regulator [Verrucosispora sp. WMMD573]